MRPTLARLAVAAAVFAVMVGAAHPAFAAAAPAPSPPPQLSQVIDNARLWVMGLLTAVATGRVGPVCLGIRTRGLLRLPAQVPVLGVGVRGR